MKGQVVNFVFSTQTFLAVWNKVDPVFKIGNRASVSNYRPIGILTIFYKVFEFTIHERMSQNNFKFFSAWFCQNQINYYDRFSQHRYFHSVISRTI
jgi:hypothetical protein